MRYSLHIGITKAGSGDKNGACQENIGDHFIMPEE